MKEGESGEMHLQGGSLYLTYGDRGQKHRETCVDMSECLSI